MGGIGDFYSVDRFRNFFRNWKGSDSCGIRRRSLREKTLCCIEGDRFFFFVRIRSTKWRVKCQFSILFQKLGSWKRRRTELTLMANRTQKISSFHFTSGITYYMNIILVTWLSRNLNFCQLPVLFFREIHY